MHLNFYAGFFFSCWGVLFSTVRCGFVFPAQHPWLNLEFPLFIYYVNTNKQFGIRLILGIGLYFCMVSSS